jgi:hypothetical protein
MMPRDEWEAEEAERLLEAVRRRRKALDDFAATLPALLAAQRSDEARAQMQPLVDQLTEFLSNFHMNNLDEMERLRLEVTRLAQSHV